MEQKNHATLSGKPYFFIWQTTARQRKVSLLIDELISLDPLEPRSIKLHGEAEILQLEEGFRGPGTYIVITPKVSWSSGIEGPAFQDGKPVIKKIIW